MTDEFILGEEILKLMYSKGCSGFYIPEDLEQLRDELMSILKHYRIEKK